MNGQQSAEQAAQNAQESHLAYLLNSANGQGALMGYPGAAALAGVQRLGYGVADTTLEEQILQRASALRAEALMQQQQQAQQRQHHLGAALAALQQKQQLSALTGLNPAHLAALSAQEQEALMNRASALRELGMAGGAGAALPAAAFSGAGIGGAGMERLQQLELSRLEELERRRQQLAALAGLSGSNGAAGVRPGEIVSSAEQRSQESSKREPAASEVKCTPVPSEKSKEDLRKTPGTVIVPCRARGMPMDHNFKTAYFVISEDAKHGEDLVCSYFACRNGGVKFRYCAHCMAPVAKRNFCRRHDHGMSAKNGDLKDDDDDDVSISLEGSDTNVKEESEPVVSNKKPVEKPQGPTSSLDVLSKAASSSLNSSTPPKETEDESKRKKTTEEEEDFELASISIKRRKLWSALLVKRPKTKDPRHLSSWLNEVLTVSDLETNLDQSEALQGETPGNGKKRKASKEEGSGFKKEKKSSGERKKIKKGKTEIKSKDLKKISKSQEASDMVVDDPPPKSSQTEGKEVESKTKVSAKAMYVEPVESDKELSPQKAVESKSSEDEKKTNAKSADKEGDGEKNSIKEDLKESTEKVDDEDGFARSFADWRDRKKEKLLKKGPGSLKK